MYIEGKYINGTEDITEIKRIRELIFQTADYTTDHLYGMDVSMICDEMAVHALAWMEGKVVGCGTLFYDGDTYLSHLGCNGCPAFRWNGCGLQLDQAFLDGATSYDTDNGKRMPGWEAKGHKADEKIDWNTYDM